MNRLTFPVLCLSRDSSIAVAETSDRLHRCNALAFFANRYYDGLLVIDSTAARFRVVRAEAAPALSAIGRWIARAVNRRLRVELQLEALGPASLDEARRTVLEWLDRAPDFWEASRDLAEWKRLVAGAGSPRALIALFA